MNGEEFSRIDRALDRHADKVGQSLLGLGTKIEGLGTRVTAVETTMRERCVAHGDRLTKLEGDVGETSMRTLVVQAKDEQRWKLIAWIVGSVLLGGGGVGGILHLF